MDNSTLHGTHGYRHRIDGLQEKRLGYLDLSTHANKPMRKPTAHLHLHWHTCTLQRFCVRTALIHQRITFREQDGCGRNASRHGASQW
jgi:hypothetical protein